MSHKPQATANYIKCGFSAAAPAAADFARCNPETILQNEASPFEAYYIGPTGSKPLVLSPQAQVPNTNPTKSGVFIRRNGVLPIVGPGSTNTKLRITFLTYISTAAGLAVGQAAVHVFIGGNATTPDVTGGTFTVSSGSGIFVLGANDLAGAARAAIGTITSQTTTGLVDLEVTFTATNSKKIVLELFGEQHIFIITPT